jgi:hypothetical protein
MQTTERKRQQGSPRVQVDELMCRTKVMQLWLVLPTDGQLNAFF